MSEIFSGKVEIQDVAKNTTILLDGDTAKISGGGSGKNGEIHLMDSTGITRLIFDAKNGQITIKNNAGDPTVYVTDSGNIQFHRKIGGTTSMLASLNGNEANLTLGNQGKQGNIFIRDSAGRNTISLDGGGAALYVGIKGNEGDIIVRNNAGDTTFHIDGNEGDMHIYRNIGGANREVLFFDASHADLYIGSQDNEGDIFVRNKAGNTSFHIDGNEGDMHIYRNIGGANREVLFFDASHAALYIGSQDNEGDIFVKDEGGNTRIHLDGHSGDISLLGADCAEEFYIRESKEIDPGTVLVIGENNSLNPCEYPYDKKVAGVVSGANGLSPGIILGKYLSQNKRVPVALNGKVYCKVDAKYSPIEFGDLLTTSSTTGHAMKALDPPKSFGAVIGKALECLKEGKGVIPILVALQ